MFNSLLRDFDEDPFFSGQFQAHNECVRQMMRSFSDPSGRDFMPMLTDGRGRLRAESHANRNLAHRDVAFRSPFSMMDNMMSQMRSRMEEVHSNFDRTDSADSSAHSFSSSSVMTYSKVGSDPAKVFQASSQMRRAPGGIKETRRCIRDSESGTEKMAIGHHIHDRGHVIERSHNRQTGANELNQDFQNLDESEAQSFDQEWQREVSKFHSCAPMSQLEAPRPRAVHRAAIADSYGAKRDKREPNVGRKKTYMEELNVKGTGVKKQ
ncbi:myeloid leukemia factor 1 [Paramormyrops kingsleyae]|uniref:Myeloid leukemia factor 1 n=1 Tax=Paramormyrops kingsleyae TaxID=1676925 RepID=A0A3B3RN21_9TELE|nr:myeloid leukemia factor 1 [Paramormyrops kingsleyae]